MSNYGYTVVGTSPLSGLQGLSSVPGLQGLTVPQAEAGQPVASEKSCSVCGHGWSHHVAGARCAHVFGTEGDVTHMCGCEEVSKSELTPELATVIGGVAALALLGR